MSALKKAVPWVWLLALASAASCAANVNQEIKLSLISVDVLEQDQIADPGNALADNAAPGNTGPQVRVTFSSKTNLQKVSMERGYNISQVIGLCDGANVDAAHTLWSYGDVYDEKAMISRTRPSSFGTSRERRAGEIRYHFYFYPRKFYRDPKSEALYTGDIHSYDLTRSPQDLCFSVSGASSGGSNEFRTNVVVVPKSALIEAFRRSRLECSEGFRFCVRIKK